MKIGILETGKPPLDLAQRFGSYPDMFAKLLGEDYRYAVYDVQAGELPARPDEQAGFLITGSPAGVYDKLPWIAGLAGFLREAKGRTKLVGICFGHQIMAETFGGRVVRSDLGWAAGLQDYHVVRPAAWMDGAGTVAIPVSHQDQVIEQPPNSRVIGHSDYSCFGMLEYEDQPAVSFQCHPEFEPAYAKALVEVRRDRLPDPDGAIASLDAANDRARMGGWIRGFLAA
jgi:GMP synthase-like glutamine amidotransferase